MSESLGERIRAKREHGQSRPREAAKAWAKEYIDTQVDKATRSLKQYVDQRIAKLAADNKLANDK